MSRPSLRVQRWLSVSLLAGVTLTPPVAAQTTGASPDSPTAGILTPEQINAQWIAANAKYDPERKRLLSDVEKTIAAGHFREDWQSLRGYQAPDWFRDA